MSHPDKTMLAAFASQMTTYEEHGDLLRHLLTCAACQNRVAEMMEREATELGKTWPDGATARAEVEEVEREAEGPAWPGAFVDIRDDAMETIRATVEATSGEQVGGLLFGRHSDDRRMAIVTMATPPPTGSRGSADDWHIGDAGVAAMCRALFDVGLYWLGTWHYRPGKDLATSEISATSMMRYAWESGNPAPIYLLTNGRIARASAWGGDEEIAQVNAEIAKPFSGEAEAMEDQTLRVYGPEEEE